MKRKNNPTDMIVITRRHVAISAIFLVGVAVVAFVLLSARQQDGTTDSTRVEIPHIHGLGFSSDGSRLLVPAHIGLLSYENSRWSQPDLPAHDYMGFSPVDTGFYSSGHPDLRPISRLCLAWSEATMMGAQYSYSHLKERAIST